MSFLEVGYFCICKQQIHIDISLQDPKKILFPKKRKAPKRASLFAPLSGSMTAEAAAALPLFLFAMVNILSLFLMFQKFENELAELHQLGRTLSLAGYEKGSQDGENMIRLVRPSLVKPIVPIAAYPGSLLVNCCYMRMWNGYDAREADGALAEGEQIVYVTENGSVYHKNRGCTHLQLTISLTGREEVGGLRNASGEKYYACEKCGKDDGGSLYITEEGNRWHSSLSCGSLKRTIRAVPVSEAAGLPACRKCG